MAIYKNVTSATTTTLTIKDTAIVYYNRISISNNSSNAATVSLFLDDGTNNNYYFKNVVIPSGVSLVHSLTPFLKEIYLLKITNSGTSPDISVILS
jgi:hypothetical protein